jgi:hypothetical protein
MKKIRIKVKQLIIVIPIIVIITMFIIPKIIYKRAEALADNDIDTSKILYKRYINMVPFKNKKVEAMFRLAEQIAPSRDVLSMYEFHPNASGGTGRMLTSDVINNAAKYYKEIYTNYQGSEYYEKSYGRLLEIYTAAGEFNKSKKLIEEGMVSKNKYIKLKANKYNILYLTVDRKYEEAKKLCRILIMENNKDIFLFQMLGDIYFYEGDYNKALEIYTKGKELKEKLLNNNETTYKEQRNQRIYTNNIYSFGVDDKIYEIDKFKDIYTSSGEFHGKLIINGKPVPFARIYLKNSRWYNLNGYSSFEEGFFVLTDFEGKYVIPNLPEGNYVFSIQIPSIRFSNERTVYQKKITGWIDLKKGDSKEINFNFVKPLNILGTEKIINPVDNKVNIHWETVEGASYYQVFISNVEDPFELSGSSTTVTISDKVFNTEYVFDIDKINNMSVGNFNASDGLYNIQAYLGTFFPGAKVPYSVNAYNKKGDIITSSMPVLAKYEDVNLIVMSQQDLLEGDRLLIDKKPLKAVEFYESYLKNNPNDIHSLMVLSRIYKIGTRYNYETGENEGKDIHKSIQLSNKIYKLTGDIEYLRSGLSSIEYYINTEEDYKWAIKEILKLPEKKLTEDQYQSLAVLELKLKNFKQSNYYYEKANLTSSYCDEDYVLLKLYLEDFSGALKLAESDKFTMYRGNKNKFIEGIKALEDIDKTSEAYIAFKDIIKSIISREKGYKEKYKAYTGKFKGDLKNIVKQIEIEYDLYDN